MSISLSHLTLSFLSSEKDKYSRADARVLLVVLCFLLGLILLTMSYMSSFDPCFGFWPACKEPNVFLYEAARLPSSLGIKINKNHVHELLASLIKLYGHTCIQTITYGIFMHMETVSIPELKQKLAGDAVN